MIRPVTQESIDILMYKGMMYDYTKKQMYKDTSDTKKYFVSRSEEDIIFTDSKVYKIWEIPYKYYNTGNDPVKTFLMNNNIKGYLNKEYWKRKEKITHSKE